MKKLFFIAVAIATSISFSYSYSQENELVSGTSNEKTFSAGRREYSGNVIADRTFAKHFRSAKNISWSETIEELIARFKMRDAFVIAWFTKSGQLYCTNYYGTEKLLPVSEKRIVKEKYPGYNIKASVKIVKDQVTAYVVTIQNCDNQKKIKMVEGDTEEIENLILAK